MAQPVVHFEITGPDRPALQSFYQQLFDWECKTNDDNNYTEVKTGPDGIGGGLMASPTEQFRNYVTVYVSVDDLQSTLDQATKLGGQTVVPPTKIGEYGSYAMFNDPAGNMIGLWTK